MSVFLKQSEEGKQPTAADNNMLAAFPIAAIWLVLVDTSFLRLPNRPLGLSPSSSIGSSPHRLTTHSWSRPLHKLYSASQQEEEEDRGVNDHEKAPPHTRPFREVLLVDMGWSPTVVDAIVIELVDVGLLGGDEGTPETLIVVAQDFVSRPEIFSSLLITDFGLSPVVAHQVRAGVMSILLQTKDETDTAKTLETHGIDVGSAIADGENPLQVVDTNRRSGFEMGMEEDEPIVKRLPYNSVVVNKKAKERRAVSSDNDGNGYGLPLDYETKYPALSAELQDFYVFMTQASTSSQDSPIQPATAIVYMKHAKQFLGWYAATRSRSKDRAGSLEGNHNSIAGNDTQLSLFTVFPDKEKKSAEAVLEFILWLRSSRKISVSYEANICRGLIKVLKFRFAQVSEADPSYGEKSFDDIPLIREVRKLHRDAGKRQNNAPRSSDESQKWLSWPEYLVVVEQLQKELVAALDEYKTSSNDEQQPDPPTQVEDKDGKSAIYSPLQRKLATLFQKYLILAFFSSVPDRQRTIRELEIGRSFVKDESSGCWGIKHAPEDYKTGKSYGERPLLQLSGHLTPWIDEFIAEWRTCLVPLSQNMFVQRTTGKPLTQNSVYQTVSRACYQYTGKRTNPHLLRDMLVTHVRESDASEKQLEALALYMGHSIQMQRSSYDRRTLTKKVAPAVELMQSVNSQGGGVATD